MDKASNTTSLDFTHSRPSGEVWPILDLKRGEETERESHENGNQTTLAHEEESRDIHDLK